MNVGSDQVLDLEEMVLSSCILLKLAMPSPMTPPCTGASLPSLQAKYVVLVVACFSLPALASILKDKVFRSEKARLGMPLDIFVVNSFGSAFQVSLQ